MEICIGQPKLFRGCGLTIDEPAIQLSANVSSNESSDNTHWRIDNAGSWQVRIETVLERSLRLLAGEQGFSIATASTIASVGSIRIEKPPMAHVGLGSGTQIACSVATLIAATRIDWRTGDQSCSAIQIWKDVAVQDNHSPLRRLADATGRGARSYVGLASHLHGGFIVDHGISANLDDREVDCLPIPEAWHVVLARPISSSTISGSQEKDYFVRCAVPNPHLEAMLRMIEDEMIPAIRDHDLARFGEAVYSYGRYGGELFQSVQGGIYRDTAVAELIAAIRGWGISATGQTSWGPTVYAIVHSKLEAIQLEKRLRSKFDNKLVTVITRVTNQPASVTFQTLLSRRR